MLINGVIITLNRWDGLDAMREHGHFENSTCFPRVGGKGPDNDWKELNHFSILRNILKFRRENIF